MADGVSSQIQMSILDSSREKANLTVHPLDAVLVQELKHSQVSAPRSIAPRSVRPMFDIVFVRATLERDAASVSNSRPL